MKQNKLLLLQSIAVPLLVGVLASVLTGGSMKTYEMMNKPPLSPPAWIFPVVWTILYILMGIAFYLVIQSGKAEEELRKAAAFFWLL